MFRFNSESMKKTSCILPFSTAISNKERFTSLQCFEAFKTDK